MPIEIRLKAILQKYGKDTTGVVQRMASDLGVHRHSIGKLYRNQLKNPSLKLLDQVCDWLTQNDIPADVLPHQLFGFQAMQLWEAIAASKHVTFYLGEYLQETSRPGYRQRWISRWDADAVNGIIKHLTMMEPPGESRPQLRTVYASFRAGIDKGNPRAAELKEDIKASKRLFEQMRSQSAFDTPIIIGSQRVNYLLEHFVGDLFHCEPFQPGPLSRIPFYLKYRPGDRTVPSCFGGRDGPPGCKSPGVYYLTSKDGWIACPWERRKHDAGVAIVTRDPGNGAVEMAIFGFSGWATVLIAHQLHHDARQFWPPSARTLNKEVGVYICRIKFRHVGSVGADLVVPEAEHFEVIPIEKSILEERFG